MVNDVYLPSRTHPIPVNHISYQAESSIRKMIKPLNKLGGIDYFCYGENYPNSSGFTLHTNATFYESWFENEGILFGFHLQGWHVFDHLMPQKILEVAHAQDLGNFVTYIERHKDKTVIFEFGSRPDNTSSLEFYKNNPGLLRKFGQYFINTLGKDLIAIGRQQPIMPPEWMIKGRTLPYPSALFPCKNAVPLEILTEQEQCFLSYILRGYANNDLASKLHSNPKLISKKLTLIKKKLQCRTKSELFHKAHHQGAIEYQFDNQWLNLIKEDDLDDSAKHFLKQIYHPLCKLSQQELFCYRLLLQGYTLAEMSQQLSIGIPTIADYINRLKAKLGCKDKIELFNQAIHDGYLRYSF